MAAATRSARSGGTLEQAGALQGQEGPQALAAGENRIAHGLRDPRMQPLGLGQNLVEGLVDQVGGVFQRLVQKIQLGGAGGENSHAADDSRAVRRAESLE